DRRFWAISAMMLLDHADAEEEQFHREYSAKHAALAARDSLDQELWQRLYHPSEDRFISAVFNLVGPHLARRYAKEHTEVGLDRSGRVLLPGEGSSSGGPGRGAAPPVEWFPARAVRHACKVLGVAAPDLFYRGEDPTQVTVLNLRDGTKLAPTLVVGSDIGK